MGKSSSFRCFRILLLSSFFSLLLLSARSLPAQQNDTLANKQKTVQPGDSVLNNQKNIKSGDSLNNKQNPVPPGDSLSKKQSSVASDDSLFNVQRKFSSEDLIRGERLFYGLAYTKDKSINCSSCHNTSISDTLNWNPDALEISLKFADKKAIDLRKVLLKPIGKKLSQVHKGFLLTAEDVILLKAYMDKFVYIGMKGNKPDITNLLLLIIASIIFLVAAVDIILKKVFKKRWMLWAVLSVTGGMITWILVVNAIGFGRATGFSPDQPIKFSHAVHAGQNKIDCNYCHASARSSKTAGIPAGNICMNCHLLVRTGTRSGVTEISKVVAAYENKRAVDWVRIYKLPDFVFFSHAQHVTAGGITCDACHGNVKEMDRLYQVPDLSMGWCIKCHETRKVNFSNQYYKTYYPQLYDSLNAGKLDSVRVAGIGGKDCGKCHY